MKLLLRNLTLTFAVTLGLLSFTNSIPEVLAQHPKVDLSGRGTPSSEGEGGTGSRDDCIITDKPLTALVPTQKIEETPRTVGLTISGHPTFFFYVPQTRAQVASFTLVDANDKPIYKTEVQLPNTPDVISLTMPAVANSSELQVGEDYRWTFAIICDRNNRSEDVFVNGLIQRISRPDLTQQLETATLKELLAIYAKEGIWHEMLTTLYQLRRANPNDTQLAEFWANILKLVGLE